MRWAGNCSRAKHWLYIGHNKHEVYDTIDSIDSVFPHSVLAAQEGEGKERHFPNSHSLLTFSSVYTDFHVFPLCSIERL